MNESTTSTEPVRALDVIIPSYNRPALLHELLATGLALGVPGMHLVVIDDGSTVSEEIEGLGTCDTQRVCESFDTDRVIYVRNPENMGLARSWERYYREYCNARYTLSVTDKDEFIEPGPIVRAIEKLDADPGLSMVVIPLRQKDRSEDDRPLDFDYPRMSGREFLARYVDDNMLQHCSMWGVSRVSAGREAGLPRSLHLRRYGLDDAFGLDLDFVLMMATTGDVDFESEAHIRRSTLGGATERYPLTFAYTYFQYAKRVMRELRRRGFISRDVERTYIGFWILLINRGLRVAYRPVHGTELEEGTKRIRGHLRIPIHLYILLHLVRYRISPSDEIKQLFRETMKIMIGDRFARLRNGPPPDEPLH
jgi:glycosyltransferase involved in cell wall biosynthesis